MRKTAARRNPYISFSSRRSVFAYRSPNVRFLDPISTLICVESQMRSDATVHGFWSVGQMTIAISRGASESSDIARRFLGGHFNAENAKARRAAEDRLQSSRLNLTMQCNRTADEHRRDFVFWPFAVTPAR